jgi:raffinose/stachyose/melibiose transport system substrate-binding protein
MHSARRLAPRWTAAARRISDVVNGALSALGARSAPGAALTVFEARSTVHRLPRPARLVAAATATLLATALVSPVQAADTITLTVWDFKSSDPTLAPYFEQAAHDFEAAHPGVKVQHVAQPHDQYYTLLGTAIAANRGPDVVLLHGGTETTERGDALVPLNSSVADIKNSLVGWDAFTAKTGNIYAVPITLQGMVVYYNKDLYKKAGLDPNKPPKTWAELDADCKQIISKAKVACFALGNKEGFGAEFFLSTAAANFWTDKQQADWANGTLAWSDPAVSKILHLWVDTAKAGWYPRGSNSTAMFPDEFEAFERGSAANVTGLISDVAHWKQFEDFLGADKIGSFLPVSISPDGKAADPNQTLKLPLAGGIGWGVTRWTPHKDLAIAYVKSLASKPHLETFFKVGGAIVSDQQFDRAKVDSPNGKKILEWISCCRAPMAHNMMSTAVRNAFHRDSQGLFDGSLSIEKASAELDALRTKSQ